MERRKRTATDFLAHCVEVPDDAEVRSEMDMEVVKQNINTIQKEEERMAKTSDNKKVVKITGGGGVTNIG